MRALTLMTVTMAACAGSVDCDTGYADIDGVCYEDAAEPGADNPIDAYLAAAPECEPGQPGDSELSIGCIRGECVGSGTWGALSASLSMTATDCDVYSTLSFCAIDGYDLQFYDEDGSGTLTDADTLDALTVSTPAERDADGHGVGVSLDCYVDALGPPRTMDFEGTGEDAELLMVSWSVLGLGVADGLVTQVRYRP